MDPIRGRTRGRGIQGPKEAAKVPPARLGLAVEKEGRVRPVDKVERARAELNFKIHPAFPVFTIGLHPLDLR